jgi:hypothetical protein
MQKSYYCCMDNSGMTSFYDSRMIGDYSGFLQNSNSGYWEGSS